MRKQKMVKVEGLVYRTQRWVDGEAYYPSFDIHKKGDEYLYHDNSWYGSEKMRPLPDQEVKELISRLSARKG
jgi:hypothetical protein